MTNGTTSESYTYNAVGSRTASHLSNTYTHQPFNRLASTQTATYGHDANGNMVQKSEGSNFWRYTWDYENRMTEASTRRQRVRYKYDALGRRVRSFVAGNWEKNTKFIYDGLDVVMDDDSGTLTKYQNGPGIDNRLSLKTGADVKYFLTDHLGSTNGLADNTGAVTSQTAYDSFGNQTGSLATRYGFTGRERDDFTGLMHYRARSYDPKLGRFISEDPIGLAGGDFNLYGYVKNNPIRYTDPLGLLDPIVYQDPRIYSSDRNVYSGSGPVFLCCRDLDVNPVVDNLTRTLGLKHCFIRTTNKEAGMGPAGNGPLPSYPYGTDTTINDHTGQSSQSNCVSVCNVDEKCVERELELEKSTGMWTFTNNCNTFANDVFRKCRKDCNVK